MTILILISETANASKNNESTTETFFEISIIFQIKKNYFINLHFFTPKKEKIQATTFHVGLNFFCEYQN